MRHRPLLDTETNIRITGIRTQYNSIGISVTTYHSTEFLDALDKFKEIDSVRKPISFFSEKLTKTQTNYSTFSRELLAVDLAIKQFRHILEGRNFAIYTDHKSLIYAMNCSTDKYTPAENRYLDFISQYTTDLRHIKGQQNIVADALSHTDITAITDDTLSHDLISDEQKSDSTLTEILSNSSLTLKDCPVPFGNKTLYCDTTLTNPKPYIPPTLRKQIFQHLHNLSHSSKRSTVKIISERFVWPNMASDINQTSIANAVLKDWISIFGVPNVITTDRGTQFRSSLFQEFSNLLGAKNIKYVLMD